VTLILDTGPIVAALNEQDPDHRRCAALLSAAQDLLVPSPVLVEVDCWLVKLAGAKVWSDFVADINRGAYRVAHPTDADLTRAAELESTERGAGSHVSAGLCGRPVGAGLRPRRSTCRRPGAVADHHVDVFVQVDDAFVAVAKPEMHAVSSASGRAA
jgi:hypothetical protein